MSGQRWTKDRAQGWYDEQPYFVGANFYPSTAINQLEMWQGDTFDPETIDRELGCAESLGMTIMRVYLHDLLWEQDAAGFCDRMDQYLAIADSHGIKTMFVFFDDCWRQEFALGKQRDPEPCKHNSGWVQSPGAAVVNDPSQWGRLETYVKGVLTRFKDDPRVGLWDLYNEPGNGTTGDDTEGDNTQGDRSLPLLKAIFGWAREVGPSQPLTCAVWAESDTYKGLTAYSLENSDILTFHSYDPPAGLVQRIEAWSGDGRPMICSEYLARSRGSNFEHCLTLMKKRNIGAINWGLVSGKSQTIYPWGWAEEMGEPDIYFHDVFHADGTMLYPDEKRVIQRVTGVLAE